MSRAMALSRFGEPEVLQWRDMPDAPPGPGEVRIRHTAIGVNFTDVHGRRGDYANVRAMALPLVPGIEAAGVVESAGPGVERFRPGERVAYASHPMGAYCETRNFPAERCVRLPDGLAAELAVSVLLKGLTVHMLVRRVFRVEPGHWVVFHSAAGGVGVIAGQWLRALGARAIGVVGSADKLAAAREAGYEAVFVRGRDDWPARVRELTGGAGVPLVCDPVGQATWEGSLDCLAPRGHLVCFGNASGLVPPFSVNVLRDRGSLSVSWVRFSDYTADRADLGAAADELFGAIAAGRLTPRAPRAFALGEAAAAHRLLESGTTSGPLVLVP